MVQGLKQNTTLQNGVYRIEKVLGQGSFGITYLATAKFTTQGNLGKMNVEAKVAIKEFFMSEVNTRQSDESSVGGSSGSVFTNYRKKFRKEAENLSKLSHPNIVKVFDVFDENNTTYYVMEFLEGTNLDDYIKQNGHLAEDEAIVIVKEVGEALAYMHSQKMLHLDVKPKNIMRKSDGKDYLIDFGLAKQFTEEGEPESSTSIGLGTPGYAPIEQSGYKQDGTFPATLDVYALGATLFKMLTGKRPPEATNVLNEGFPNFELSSMGITNHTVNAVEKAMEPVKKKRYHNVKAFLKGLDNHDIEDVTIIETPMPPKPQPTPHTKPNSNSDSNSDSTPKYKWIWYVAFSIFVIGVIVIWRNNIKSDPLSPVTDSTKISIDAKEEVQTTKRVSEMLWESPLGKAIYTGTVEPDTIDGSTKFIPHGKGVAKIIAGQYSGNVYEGEFEWGKMQGNTTYTQKNGDTFVGTFKYNKYHQGRYTVKSSGEYYEGTFRDMQPRKGKWYSSDGSVIEEIKIK